MCRMITLVDNRDLSGIRNTLYSSLVKASREDPYLLKLYGKSSHRDGWGYALLEVGEALRYTLFKSLKPIYEDSLDVLHIRRGVKAVEIVHARAATRGTPINIHSTHPLEVSTANGYKMLLAHNGSVDKLGLARLIGYTEGEFSLYNDSYFMAK